MCQVVPKTYVNGGAYGKERYLVNNNHIIYDQSSVNKYRVNPKHGGGVFEPSLRDSFFFRIDDRHRDADANEMLSESIMPSLPYLETCETDECLGTSGCESFSAVLKAGGIYDCQLYRGAYPRDESRWDLRLSNL